MTRRKDGRWQHYVKIEGSSTPKYFYSSMENEDKAWKDIQNQMIEYKSKKHYETHNFKKIADIMIEKKQNTTSYNNTTNYINQLKHLSPLYKYNIEDITLIQLQNIFNTMHNKSYGYWTLQKTKTVLGLIYKEAMILGCSVTNLVEFIKIPNFQKEIVHSPEDNVISIIKQNANKDFGMWAMMLLCTGMRRGELAAIQKNDIDFNKKTISIVKSVEYIPNQPNIKTPKTKNGFRTVPIIDLLFPFLKEYCKTLSANDYLFGYEKPYTLTMLRKRWDKYLKMSGLLITQHQLRHAFSFLLYRSGIDVKTAQYLLGHSNYSTTMNIYTDFDKSKIDASANMLNTTMSAF